MDGELELLDENFEKQYRSPLIQRQQVELLVILTLVILMLEHQI